MKNYRHIFFDLDRTLWDFEANSLITLQEIFENRKLTSFGIPDFDIFLKFYKTYNIQLWDLYKQGKVEKEYLSVERFDGTLRHFSIKNEELARKIAKDYVQISPTKTKLFPFVNEILTYLKEKYQLHIITNGFNEVQFVKLKNSRLDQFFTKVITSEMIGIQKPNPKIFEYALSEANAASNESIMIGDDQKTDIIGAQNFGMDQVFVDYNFEALICNPSYRIHHLKELEGLL